MTSTALHLFHKKRVRTPFPFPEGVNGVNRLATKGEKYFYQQNEKQVTDLRQQNY